LGASLWVVPQVSAAAAADADAAVVELTVRLRPLVAGQYAWQRLVSCEPVDSTQNG
jgi:hypothetical protein